ncbi:MAG: lipoyl synthase [Verrucomicrobia bacterium]|nr:lipoyl synthase [Verrucomicrobiota bacterium]MBU1909556.1 lipoyl synthase [Verrucomicrobiota bacterium]
MPRLPSWIRADLRTDEDYGRVDALLRRESLHTVCVSARCPNRPECWNRGTATMMILGEVCTRGCGFCAVTPGRPTPPEDDEPERVARAAAEMGLKHLVVTSVTRDDLADGGAGAFARTIQAVRNLSPRMKIEVLTPDFLGSEKALAAVLAARPDVFGHNLETVRRLTPAVRAAASYDRSLAVLRFAAAWTPPVVVKSGLMLGLGETAEEVLGSLDDLWKAGCRWLTLGQYLAPTARHVPVERFVTPEEFAQYADRARRMGFLQVAAGPLVRSSYRAAEGLAAMERETATCPAC